MQSTASQHTSQSDNINIMQPQQNMIFGTNKKKKLPLTQSAKQTQPNIFQQQFQYNKPINVVSVLKSQQSNLQHQQHHHQHHYHHHHYNQFRHPQQLSYANIQNRSIPPSIICKGAVLTLNNCPINSTALISDTVLMNERGHCNNYNNDTSFIKKNNSTEPNCLLSTGYLGNSDKTKYSDSGGGTTGVGVAEKGMTDSCTSGILKLSHSYHPGSQSGGSYSHKKVIVGVNHCSTDNRNYDSNNKIHNNFFNAQEFPSSGTANVSNVRANQQTGLYQRAPSGNPNPRGGTRPNLVTNLYAQPIQHSLVTPYAAYGGRQPQFQTQQSYTPYSHSTIPPNYFFHSIYMPTQPPLRTAMNVNASVGTMAVQSGSNVQLPGQPGTSQAQIPLAPSQVVGSGATTVLGVGPTAAQIASPQIVGVVPGNIQNHPQQTSKPVKSHPNRLKIIDPNTNKNILDELDLPKPAANIDLDFQEQQQQLPTAQSDYTMTSTPQTDHNVIPVHLMTEPQYNNMRYDAEPQQIQQHQQQQHVNQTPIVSAMSDAPSIEIPSIQKPRSKKIPIVAPKIDNLPSCNTEEGFKEPEQYNKDGIKFDSNSNINSNSHVNVPAQTAVNTPMPVPVPVAVPMPMPVSVSVPVPVPAPVTVPLQPTNNWNDNNNYENNETGCNISNVAETTNATSAVITSRHLPLPAVSQSEEITAPLTSDAANQTIKQSNVDTFCDSLDNMKITDDNQTYETVPTPPPTIPSANIHLINEDRVINENETKSGNGMAAAVSNETKTEDYSISHKTENVTCDETDRVGKPFENTPVHVETHDHNVTKTQESGSKDTNESTTALETTIDPEGKSNADDELNVAESDAPTAAQLQSLITYDEGQWSPNNPNGKKQYSRKQLLQLREAEPSRIQPSVKYTSILPQKNLMPAFANYNSNKRGQSMMGAIGRNRSGDVNTGNYGGKQTSMSGSYGPNSNKEKMKINLSLNQDVKLNETDNAWRPRVLLKNGQTEADVQSKAQQEKEELIRRVRGILNKLTPEKFDTLVEEIIKLKIDTADKMEDVMVLVFEKAIDEPNFSVSYARLCHRLISEVKARDERMESDTKTNLALFRNALLDKTEREFVQNVTGTAAKEEKLKPIIEQIKNCQDPNEKAELEALLEDEERKIRRRSVGTVRFIGELFKISMLTGKIINSCIETLLKNNNEDMLECLCKLLTTVGAKFEQTPKNAKENPKITYSLDKTMLKMQAIASKTDKDAKVSSRVRFMLQDVIDLRKKNWELTRNEAPTTMEQIEKETKNAQLSSHYLNYSGSLSTSGTVNSSNSSQMGSNNKRDDRGNNRFNDSRSGYGGSHSQRGEAGSMRRQQGGNNSGNNSGHNIGNSNGLNDDNTWHIQTGKGSRSTGIDTNKLEGLLNQNLDMKKMGGVSQFIWNKDIRMSSASITPSNSFAALSPLNDINSNDRDRDRDRDHDRDRDRDRGGLRNKGSYNKNSMERDRYGGDRGMNSRNVSSQGTRENSSSRNSQGMRGMMNSSNMQKSTSQSKYSQQMPSSRLPSKSGAISSGSGIGYHRGEQSSSSEMSSYGAAPTVYKEPSSSELNQIKTVLTELLEGAANSKSINSSDISCFKRINASLQPAFFIYILTDYLHLASVGQTQRRYLANIVEYLIKTKKTSVDHFRLAYSHFCESANDLIVDIPELWKYIVEFTGPLLEKQVLKIQDLWVKQLIEENESCNYSLGKKFLKTLLTYSTYEIGPSFTRTMWKNSNMKWTEFVPAADVKAFLTDNNFEYIEDENKKPVIELKDKEKVISRVCERVEFMLKEGSSRDNIIDYINGNIVDIDKSFIRNFTTTLCNYAIAYKEDIYKLDTDRFQKGCIPLFQRYIDSNPEMELECLTAMQVLVNSLEHPRGLLSDLFGELYDAYVIPQESFIKWRDSKDQSAGKGVAVKGLNPFFTNMLSGETSDENNC